MTSLAYFPIKEDSFIYARERAKEESLEHPDQFIYLFKSNGGWYVIDYLGINHDDERILATFKNGEKTL